MKIITKLFVPLALFIAVGFIGYGVGRRSSVMVGSSTSEINSSVQPDEKQIEQVSEKAPTNRRARNIVDIFEKFQVESEAENVMALFTLPGSAEESDEKKTYYYDSGDPKIYSTVNLGVHLQSYVILSVDVASSSAVVKVREHRNSWDNLNGKWVNLDPVVKVFEVIEVGHRTMIDKYYNDGEFGKYGGFW